MVSSIFILKADKDVQTGDCSMIRYYRGTDWFLEDIHEVSHSFQFITQEKGHEYLYYSAREMAEDWTGGDLLECIEIPYCIWNQENGWRWDQLGTWYRCIGPDTGEPVEQQWEQVSRWIKGGKAPVLAPVPAPVLAVPVPAPTDIPDRRGYYPSYTVQDGYERGERRVRGRGGQGWRGSGDRRGGDRESVDRGSVDRGSVDRGRGGRGRGDRGKGDRGRGDRGRGDRSSGEKHGNFIFTR